VDSPIRRGCTPRFFPASLGLHPSSRAVDEYLAVPDDAGFGAATEVTPKFVSPVDPAARWTGAHGGQAFFGYSDNYLINIDNSIIVDVRDNHGDPTGRSADCQAHDRMLDEAL
jgi:hypothetical protein